MFHLKVGQNSQRSAHKHSISVKKNYSWFRKSNFHHQKSVRINTIKDSKLSFSCPKFILTIHLVVGVFSLWLLIGQSQLHTKWFIYWQVTLCPPHPNTPIPTLSDRHTNLKQHTPQSPPPCPHPPTKWLPWKEAFFFFQKLIVTTMHTMSNCFRYCFIGHYKL